MKDFERFLDRRNQAGDTDYPSGNEKYHGRLNETGVNTVLSWFLCSPYYCFFIGFVVDSVVGSIAWLVASALIFCFCVQFSGKLKRLDYKLADLIDYGYRPYVEVWFWGTLVPPFFLIAASFGFGFHWVTLLYILFSISLVGSLMPVFMCRAWLYLYRRHVEEYGDPMLEERELRWEGWMPYYDVKKRDEPKPNSETRSD